MATPIKPPCPCTQDCKGREMNCQLFCTKYKIYRVMRDKFYIERAKQREQEHAIIEQTVRTAAKAKRRGGKYGGNQ